MRSIITGMLDRTERVLDTLSTLMVWVCLTAISVQIFMRYVIGNATTWSDTVAASALAWMTFLAGTAAVRKNQNLAVTFIQVRIRGFARRLVDTLCHLVTLLFSAALAVSGAQLMSITSTALIEGLVLEITWAQMYSITVISGVLMALFSLEKIAALWLRSAP